MMHRRERRAWAMAFCLSLLALIALTVSQIPSKPYRDVEALRLEQVGDEVILAATFVKTECEFKRLRVVYGLLGETGFLPWRDMDGLPEDHDRNAGTQTLRIAIAVPAGRYDWVEVRTRHLCGEDKDGDGDPDETVDKVFYRFTALE